MACLFSRADLAQGETRDASADVSVNHLACGKPVLSGCTACTAWLGASRVEPAHLGLFPWPPQISVAILFLRGWETWNGKDLKDVQFWMPLCLIDGPARKTD